MATIAKWYGRAFVAVAGSLILAQIDLGFYGWLVNGLLVFCVMAGAFMAGWLDQDPPRT